MTRRYRMLKPSTVARRLAAAGLAGEGAAWSEAASLTIQRLPDWVGSAGLVEGEGVLWLWAGAAPRATSDIASSQAVLDAPRGRYRLDTIDPQTGDIVAREIATAPPLVIGLPRRAAAVLVRVERIA
ncbi:MAG: hypothetical protein KJ061_07565 [Vicinamibacteraceae bacterium]|nr:hypothetical protein [Vicinamibacteraceae bacterium]